MIVFGIILGLGLMGGMVFMALNKKSNFAIRVASLIALAIMLLTAVICFIIIFTDDTVVIDESIVNIGVPVEVQESSGTDIIVLILVILILLGLFAVLVFYALKEHKKIKQGSQSKPASSW